MLSWTAEPLKAVAKAGRAGYDGYKWRNGSKANIAVDTPGHLIALTVTPTIRAKSAHKSMRCASGCNRLWTMPSSGPGKTKAKRAELTKSDAAQNGIELTLDTLFGIHVDDAKVLAMQITLNPANGRVTF